MEAYAQIGSGDTLPSLVVANGFDIKDTLKTRGYKFIIGANTWDFTPKSLEQFEDEIFWLAENVGKVGFGAVMGWAKKTYTERTERTLRIGQATSAK